MPKVNRERGAAAVEMALLLPVLLLVVVGIIEFGYAFFIQGSVANAARVGVRDYTINYANTKLFTTDTLAQQASKDKAKDAVFPNPQDIKTRTFSQPCTPNASTTFTITYQYRSLTGLLDGILGTNVIVTGNARMQCGG